MKRSILYILFIQLLLICAACDNASYPPSLFTADSLANVKPDSALALLDKIGKEIESHPESTRMYYRLLCIKATDKARIIHTSDSLILPVLHYYLKKGNKLHLPEAYYYAGRVYRDLGDAPQALDYFQKSLNVMEDTENNLKVKSKVYAQIGTLFLYQNIYEEALKSFQESLNYDKILNDSIGIIYNLRDIADSYRNLDKIDSSLYFYQKAYNLAETLKNERFMNMVLSQIAGLYIHTKQYDLAEKAIRPALNTIHKQNKSSIYTIASKLFHHIGKKDSAVYYEYEILKYGTIYAKQAAYKRLMETAINKKQFQTALQHLQAYTIYTDSIEKMTNTESIRLMNALYNYQHKEQEIHKLIIKNKQKENIIIITIATFISIILFYLILVHYKKRKTYQQAFHYSILQQLEKSYKKNEKISSTKQKEYQWVDLTQAHIYIDIKKRINEKNIQPLNENDWNEIEKAINASYKNFSNKLYEKCDLSLKEYRICLLLKLKLKPLEIAKFMSCANETVSSIRRRLYKKTFKIDGSSKDWDNFIHLL